MVDGRYHLTQAADADLERLYEWGIERFGVNAADEYYEGLIARLVQIADTPQLWQEVDTDLVKRSSRLDQLSFECARVTERP